MASSFTGPRLPIPGTLEITSRARLDLYNSTALEAKSVFYGTGLDGTLGTPSDWLNRRPIGSAGATLATALETKRVFYGTGLDRTLGTSPHWLGRCSIGSAGVALAQPV